MDFEELVDWQLSNAAQQRPPTRPWQPPTWVACPKCKKEWHGLKRDGCPGSFGEDDAR